MSYLPIVAFAIFCALDILSTIKALKKPNVQEDGWLLAHFKFSAWKAALFFLPYAFAIALISHYDIPGAWFISGIGCMAHGFACWHNLRDV